MKPQKVKRKEKPKGRKKRNRGEAGQISVLNRYLLDLPTSYTLGDFRVLNLKLSWPIAENSNQPYPLSSVPWSDFLTKPTTQMLSWGAFCQLYTTFEMCFTLLSKQKQMIGFCTFNFLIKLFCQRGAQRKTRPQRSTRSGLLCCWTSRNTLLRLFYIPYWLISQVWFQNRRAKCRKHESQLQRSTSPAPTVSLHRNSLQGSRCLDSGYILFVFLDDDDLVDFEPQVPGGLSTPTLPTPHSALPPDQHAALQLVVDQLLAQLFADQRATLGHPKTSLFAPLPPATSKAASSFSTCQYFF